MTDDLIFLNAAAYLTLAFLVFMNRPGFPRHSPGSLRNAFQTLTVTADC